MIIQLYEEAIIVKYEIIIFDADETLFDFNRSEKEAFKNTMIEFNIEYDEDYHLKIYKEINSKLWKEIEAGSITQQQLKLERFKRLSVALEIDFNEIEFANSYAKNLANSSYLYDDSLKLIESLHKDYKLILVTNGLTEIQDKRIRKSTIAKYFENIIISEEVKVSKPDPKIFDIALKDIKHLDKNKVLMVGDSLTSDIQGGINFCIDTCWFNPHKIGNETNFKPTYELSDIMRLKDIIK